MTKQEAEIQIARMIEYGTMRVESRSALKTALEVMQKAPEWIPARERLPEQNKLVIVAIYGHSMIIQREGESLGDAIRRVMNTAHVGAGFVGADGWYDADGYPLPIRPAYWMEFPVPPPRVINP